MKHVILFAAALAVCSAGTAAASSNIDDVRAELRRAVAAGEISRDEAKALMRDAISVHRAERHARRDTKHAERDARKEEKAARREARRAEKKQAED